MYLCEETSAFKDPSNRKLRHQVILAKNLRGWKNLLSLVSRANHPDRFYHKPRLDSDELSQLATSDLISFSGHLGSRLAHSVVDNPNWQNDAIKEAEYMQEVFGKGNFFIEIQLIDSLQNTLAKEVANKLREVSKITGIPCVATPDAHYCKREDAHDQRVLLCTALRKSVAQIQKDIKEGKCNSLKAFFESDSYHIPTYEEIKSYDILGAPNPPLFDCPNGMSPNDYLRLLCREGWVDKMGHIGKGHERFSEYGKRVDKEISIFTETGLSSYFLIVRDILKHAKSMGYLTGPGRGSAAGCMVSYLMDITQIDSTQLNF